MLGMKTKEPKPVQKGEQILGYDRDNLKEYREYQEAEETLKHANDKGFRKPNRRAIERAQETVREYRRKKAQTFLEEHKKRIEYYGVEIKAHFDKDFLDQTGLIKPSLTIADFNPFKPVANLKPWSEALEENLATRLNCQHELNDDETACKKCSLNPENFGSNNEGVTDEYLAKQREKIAAQKEVELACERGEHVLNDEAKENPEAKAYCIHCRKPKEAWGEEAAQ